MATGSMIGCLAGLPNSGNSLYLRREQQGATPFFTKIPFPRSRLRAGCGGYLSIQQQQKRVIVIRGMIKRNPKRLKYSNPPRSNKGDGIFYLEVDPSGGDTWKLEPVIQLLKEGAVGVIPTDTVYAIVCDMKNPSAIERLRRIKGIEPLKPLSILCHSFRDIDTYTTGFPCGNSQGQTNIFRAVKHCLPGPYTFILPASKELPKQCTRYGAGAKYAWRKTVGVRMPDDAICQAILEKMGAPLISTRHAPEEYHVMSGSYHGSFVVGQDEQLWIKDIRSDPWWLIWLPCAALIVKWPKQDEWMINPVTIADIYEQEGLDFVVDGGVRVADPSTVVDMTGRLPTIIRQGKGPKQDWMISKDDAEATL